jgi:hypothetical protein
MMRAMRFLPFLSLGLCLAGCKGEAAVERVVSERIVPEELADEAAIAVLGDWQALPVFGRGRYVHQTSEDRGSGEKQAQRLWDNGNRDFNNFICRGREADAPPAQVPYVFDVPECPEGYVRGLMMARFEGSGRLARLWLTAASIRAAAPDAEVLRIYVDDEPTPRLQAPLADLLRGGAAEIFAPPFSAGSARYVAWYYPVVFSRKLVLSLDGLGDRDLYFYQASAVLDDEPHVAAETRLPGRERARALLAGGEPDAGRVELSRLVLEAGASAAIVHPGPATVVKTRLRVPRARLASLEAVRLRVRWDDAAADAIDLPLVDLFAASAGATERSSLALGARDLGDDIELRLALPMPFATQSRWTLENRGGERVELALIHELRDAVPAGRWGRLHTEVHETTSSTAPAHPLAAASGPGRLAGVCASLTGHGLVEGGRAGHPMHFLEGDELATIDGGRALGGTGTEDYFNDAFYFEGGVQATPFAQVWQIGSGRPDAPRQGFATACRWHVLGDAIDFASSLDLKLEIGPGVATVIDRYRSVAFLYR